jgi:hypothetical protein
MYHELSSPEINKSNDHYKRVVDAILDRGLSPEDITTYADDALHDLIEAVGSMQADYESQPTICIAEGNERERAAFAYYGLDPGMIESALDHIVHVSDSIARLDGLVAQRTRKINSVIVPPDIHDRHIIQPGNGNLELPNPQIPKLKTLLLILEQKFGINLEDPEAIRITSGNVPESMVRRAGYKMVEIPSLESIVLTCDEAGNVTFVFDAGMLSEHAISPEQLCKLTKPEIKDLLHKYPDIGTQHSYSKKYIVNLVNALDIVAASTGSEGLKLLRGKAEKAPEGYLSVGGITKRYGFAAPTIRRAIAELGDSLGETKEYLFLNKTVTGFDPAQVEMIANHIGLNERAPTGYLSVSAIKRYYGFSIPTILTAISELGDKLGETRKYLFGVRAATGFCAEQVEIIINHICITEKAPEGYLSASRIAEQYGLAHSTIKSAITELGDRLGETRLYMFGRSTTAIAYSPEQVKNIIDSIGISEKAPEGYLSTRGITNEYGFAAKTIISAAAELGDRLGETRLYMFGRSTTATAYSPEQIEIIVDYIRNSRKAPEGYLSIDGVVKEYSLGHTTVVKAIEALGNNLGEIKEYKAKHNGLIRSFLSPDQIRMIIEWISTNTRSKIGSAAVERVCSGKGISSEGIA